MEVKKVVATPEAAKLIQTLKEEHGDLMFHQSGGCCDGSAPMCYPDGEFRIGDSDYFMGEMEGCPFFMSSDQYDYWKHTQLIIDVTKGRGASFSLEIPMGVRFVTRSRVFTDQELEALGLLTQ